MRKCIFVHVGILSIFLVCDINSSKNFHQVSIFWGFFGLLLSCSTATQVDNNVSSNKTHYISKKVWQWKEKYLMIYDEVLIRVCVCNNIYIITEWKRYCIFCISFSEAFLKRFIIIQKCCIVWNIGHHFFLTQTP